MVSEPVSTDVARGSSGWRYRLGYATAAGTYLAIQAFSTVPSPLYPAYALRDHLSALMITVVYAAYAVGVAVSLVLAGHLSDVWGRRPVLAVAVLLNAVAAGVFVLDPSLTGLFVARVVCGLAVGITASTATAYLTELFTAYQPIERLGRVRMLSASTAVGGLGLGALLTGLIAAHNAHPLRVPYLVMLAVFAASLVGLALAPETRERLKARPRYRPQTVAVPPHARRPFVASLTGVAAVFAIFGLFVGLTGTVLAQVLHRHSVQLSGFVLFVLFGTGALCTAVANRVAHHVLTMVAGLTLTLGLALLVLSIWLPTPSLALLIVSGAVIGAGGSALFMVSLTVATAIAPRAQVAETLAGFFLAGYLGISVPVVGTGIALQHLSARATLLGFAVALAAGLVCVLPSLARTNVL